MSCTEAEVAGVSARLFRIGFTGELSFEINVPARFGLHVWEKLIEAGRGFDLTVYGTEAMHVLRAEKGYIIVGQDTDGTVTPADLGLSAMVKKERDFIGKRSLERSDTMRSDRKQLVGLRTEDPHLVLPEGAHLVMDPTALPPLTTIGHVTSSYASPNTGHSIAMALLGRGHERIGERCWVRLMNGDTIPVSVCSTLFFDPDGARSHG